MFLSLISLAISAARNRPGAANASFLLQENGDNLLLESGGFILKE